MEYASLLFVNQMRHSCLRLRVGRSGLPSYQLLWIDVKFIRRTFARDLYAEKRVVTLPNTSRLTGVVGHPGQILFRPTRNIYQKDFVIRLWSNRKTVAHADYWLGSAVVMVTARWRLLRWSRFASFFSGALKENSENWARNLRLMHFIVDATCRTSSPAGKFV